MQYNIADYVCRFCKGPVYIVTGKEIYNHREDLWHKKFHLCFDCWAYVGTHDHSGVPFGTLADQSTRAARNSAHRIFDKRWKNSKTKNARYNEYKWLAEQLNLSIDECHIGLFDVDQCNLVIELCKNK